MLTSFFMFSFLEFGEGVVYYVSMDMENKNIVPERYRAQDWVEKGMSGMKTSWQVLDKYHSVWVSASAGSGKTYLLTARVLNLLLSGVEPDKILCITYTNAGASEMKARVNEELEKWSRYSDDDLFDILRDMIYTDKEKYSDEFIRGKFEVARSLFHKILQIPLGMKIQTIHAFCQSILKKFPVEAGISPDFKIIDDRDVAELLEAAYKKVFVAMSGGSLGSADVESEFLDDDVLDKLKEEFATIVNNTSYNSFEGLRNAIISNRREFKKFFDFCESEHSDDVLGVVRSQLDKVFLGKVGASSKDELWNDFLDNNPYKTVLKDFVDEVEILGEKGVGKNCVKYAIIIKKMLEFSDDVEGFKNKKVYLREYAKVFLSYFEDANKDVKIRNSFMNKKLRTEFPHFEDFMLKEAERVYALVKGISAFDDLNYTYAVCCFAYEFIRVYQNEKSFKGGMDFDDMLDLVNKLFSKDGFAGWVLHKIDGGIDHLLVDESQDTSPFQWDIINYLTEEMFGESDDDVKSVFVVGDKKQSIYSFQGADIYHFNMFRKKLRDKVVKRYDAEKWQEVSKNVSFRTSPPVLEIVNSVLENSEGKVGVVEAEDLISSDGSVYEKGVAHISVNFKKAGEVIVFPPLSEEKVKVDKKDLLEQEWKMPYEVEDKDSSLKKVAIQVADKIQEMIEGRTWLGTKGRIVNASDFMVLVKKRNEFSNLLIRELLKRKIEVAGADKLSLNNYIAFDDLLGLLEFVVVKDDDLLLASVLKSPIFGFDENDIFKLAFDRGGLSIYDRLAMVAKEKSEILKENIDGEMDGLFTSEMKTFNEVSDEEEALNNRYEAYKFVRANAILKRCFEMLESGVSSYDFFTFILGDLMADIAFYERLGSEFEDFSDEFIKLCIEFESSSYHYLGLVGFLDWVKKSNNDVKRDLSSGSVGGVRIMTCHGSKGLEAPVVIIPAIFGSSSGGGGRVDIHFSSVEESEFSHSSFKVPVLKHPFSFAGASAEFSGLKELKKVKEEEELNRLLYVALTRSREKMLVFGLEKNDWYEKVSVAMDCHANVVFEEIDGGGKIKKLVAEGAEEFSESVVGKDIVEDEVEEILEDFFDDTPVVFRKEIDLISGKDSFVEKGNFVSDSAVEMDSLLDESFEEKSELAMRRGIVVHKLMEHIESLKPLEFDKVEKIIDEYLRGYGDLFSDELRGNFIVNILDLYEDERFRILFDNDFSASEVEFISEDGIVRLDKLVKKGNSVFVVDFKTDEISPKSFEEIDMKYKSQLRGYKKLVEDVYPDCKVYSALLYLSDLSFYFV